MFVWGKSYEPQTAFTQLENLTFQILRMAAVVELEHLGKPPEEAVFCLLCRGTIALPDVNFLLRIAGKSTAQI